MLLWLVVAASGCPAPKGRPADAGADTGSAETDAPSELDAASPLDASSADTLLSDSPTADTSAGDAGPQPTPEEEAACANLAAVAASCGGTFDEAWCLSDRVRDRVEHADPDCYPEYDAFVACLTTWSACSSSGGVPCPTEYSAFAACARP